MHSATYQTLANSVVCIDVKLSIFITYLQNITESNPIIWKYITIKQINITSPILLVNNAFNPDLTASILFDQYCINKNDNIPTHSHPKNIVIFDHAIEIKIILNENNVNKPINFILELSNNK